MKAQQIVAPTTVNPRFFKSLLSASDNGVLEGTCLSVFREFRGTLRNPNPDKPEKLLATEITENTERS